MSEVLRNIRIFLCPFIPHNNQKRKRPLGRGKRESEVLREILNH